MFKYICTECGAQFKDTRNDYHIYYGCKYCKADVEPAEHCEVCGKSMPQSKATYHRCDRHKMETLEKFKAFLADLSSGEIEYLQDITDGIYWSEIAKK